MGKRIQIKAGQVKVVAELNETRTAQAIWEALPIKGRGNRWGEESSISPFRLISGKRMPQRLSVLAAWVTGRPEKPSVSFSGRLRSAKGLSHDPPAR